MLFSILPDQTGYSAQDGQETQRVQLDGGAGRYRRDISGATSIVNVGWTLNPEGFMYVRSFYKATTDSGSLPFIMPLILDKPTITQHTAYFVPGSLQLTEQSALKYVVKAQLEVYAIEIDPNYQETYVAVLNEFGFIYNEDQLDYLVNSQLPGVF